MKDLKRIVQLSETQCFSLWYDPHDDQLYPDNEKNDNSMWVCDIDRKTDPEVIRHMVQLMLTVTDELTEKGYIK